MAEGATVGGRPVPRAKTNNSELLPKQKERQQRKNLEDQQKQLKYQERLVTGYMNKYALITKQMV